MRCTVEYCQRMIRFEKRSHQATAFYSSSQRRIWSCCACHCLPHCWMDRDEPCSQDMLEMERFWRDGGQHKTWSAGNVQTRFWRPGQIWSGVLAATGLVAACCLPGSKFGFQPFWINLKPSSVYSTTVINWSQWDQLIPQLSTRPRRTCSSDLDSDTRIKLSGDCLDLGQEEDL